MTNFERVRRSALIQSLIIDTIGMASYFLPFLGESFDLVVAPILSFWIWRLHGSAVAAIFGFFEEVIPYTDIFPTATVTWWHRFIINKETTRRSLEEGSAEVIQSLNVNGPDARREKIKRIGE